MLSFVTGTGDSDLMMKLGGVTFVVILFQSTLRVSYETSCRSWQGLVNIMTRKSSVARAIGVEPTLVMLVDALLSKMYTTFSSQRLL